MPVDFTGYWKMLANENFEEYLRALGKPLLAGLGPGRPRAPPRRPSPEPAPKGGPRGTSRLGLEDGGCQRSLVVNI